MKYEVAAELGYFNLAGKDTPREYQKALNDLKYEVAQDLGIPLNSEYNGDLTTREAGMIGGRLGGHIGGNMVRRMINYAEERLAQENKE